MAWSEAAAETAAAAAADECKSVAAWSEFCGERNGDVLALRIKWAWSCCKWAECTRAGLRAPASWRENSKKFSRCVNVWVNYSHSKFL